MTVRKRVLDLGNVLAMTMGLDDTVCLAEQDKSFRWTSADEYYPVFHCPLLVYRQLDEQCMVDAKPSSMLTA